MNILNSEISDYETHPTDAEWDADLIEGYEVTGRCPSAGWIYGIEWADENAAAWRLLENRLTAVEYQVLRGVVSSIVGVINVIEPPSA